MRGQALEPCGQMGQKRLRQCVYPAGLSPPSNCYSGANTDGPLAAHKEDSKGADWPTALSLRGQPSRRASISPVSQRAAGDRRRRRHRNTNAPNQVRRHRGQWRHCRSRCADEKVASSCFHAIFT
ncbi:hypothetical protein MTO96_001379 [Rhipicephalus appendiculatus]